MIESFRPIALATTRGEHVLLDRGGRNEATDDRLRVVFDGTGPTPCINISSPDGAIELHAADEIRALCAALRTGLRYVQAFGPPVPVSDWRRLHVR